MDVGADIDLALQLADQADALTSRRFRALDLAVETKPDLTPVSDADRSVERALRATLDEQRPNDAVIGEEFGSSGSGNRRWIVDPIDGTKNFVRGVPVWATLLALQLDGRITVGVVSAPALGRRWWAARDRGSWAVHDGETRACQVSAISNLTDAFLSYASLTGWAEQGRLAGLLALTDSVWRTRAFGDFWSHVLVAEGVVDISCEPQVSLWDLAPLQVIVEEAGGRFTDLSGTPRADGGSVVCTNGRLHDEVLSALNP